MGMINRLRKEHLDGRKRILTGAGGKHITAGSPDALHDLAHLIYGLARAEYHFRKSLPQATVVIDLRKSEILIGQVSEDFQSFFRGRPLVMNIF